MDVTRPKTYQHETLRVPRGWTDQDKALVIQIDHILDDIYKKLGQLKEAIEAASSSP